MSNFSGCKNQKGSKQNTMKQWLQKHYSTIQKDKEKENAVQKNSSQVKPSVHSTGNIKPLSQRTNGNHGTDALFYNQHLNPYSFLSSSRFFSCSTSDDINQFLQNRPQEHMLKGNF